MALIDTLKEIDSKTIKIISIPKGDILFHEDDLCEYVGIVKKGLIVIASYSISGNEIIYNQISEGGVFGNNLIFSSHPYYRGNVICKEKSEVILLDKKQLLSLFQSNEDFLIQYLKMQSQFSISLNTKLKIMTLQNAQERFFYYMELHNNEITYNSISSLANELFLRRETLSRLIAILLKEKKIEKKGKTLTLSKDKI